MDLTEQEYIVAIADCRNITRAARMLHISQPALSKYLTHVEERLGMRLFIRSNKFFQMTPAGKLYVRRAKQILQIRNEFYIEWNELTERSHNLNLKIGIQSLRATYLTPRIYREFYWSMPKGSIRILDGTRQQLLRMMENHDADLILLNNILLPQEWKLYPLREDHFLMVTSENQEIPCEPGIDGDYPIVDLEKVKDLTFLVMGQSHSTRMLLDTILKRDNILLPHLEEQERHEAAMNLVAMGNGAAFTLDSYLPYFHLAGPLKCFRIRQCMESIDYVAACHEDHLPDKLLCRIIAMLQTALKDDI